MKIDTLPKGKPTKKQEKKIGEALTGLKNFVAMFELVTRGKKVGITQKIMIEVLGHNPTADQITEEELAMIRTMVEIAEGKI